MQHKNRVDTRTATNMLDTRYTSSLYLATTQAKFTETKDGITRDNYNVRYESTKVTVGSRENYAAQE